MAKPPLPFNVDEETLNNYDVREEMLRLAAALPPNVRHLIRVVAATPFIERVRFVDDMDEEAGAPPLALHA